MKWNEAWNGATKSKRRNGKTVVRAVNNNNHKTEFQIEMSRMWACGVVCVLCKPDERIHLLSLLWWRAVDGDGNAVGSESRAEPSCWCSAVHDSAMCCKRMPLSTSLQHLLWIHICRFRSHRHPEKQQQQKRMTSMRRQLSTKNQQKIFEILFTEK